MTRSELLTWLRAEDHVKLEGLWQQADETRKRHVGDAVHLRGLVEISNYCCRECWYCGLRGGRQLLPRFRLSTAQIKDSVRLILKLGYGTVVLQAGEDPGLDHRELAEVVRWIKSETPLAVTLSLGEQPEAHFRFWRQAGADRYLLKIETTDQALLSHLHPGEPHGSRLDNIRRLQEIGFEVGSGLLVGLPGQTYESVARDLEWLAERDFDMIGIGPFVPHPDTPLAGMPGAGPDQVPNTELMTDKVLALTRLQRPDANLPATTALAIMSPETGRQMALQRGANVVMPDVTPLEYRRLYDIYPGKGASNLAPEAFHAQLLELIQGMGRIVGQGPGSRQLQAGKKS
jgi:biotin synthase